MEGEAFGKNFVAKVHLLNAFFVHGFISTISASITAKTLCPNDVNILFVERMENRFSDEYYLLNRLFEDYFKWTKIIPISRQEFLGMTKRRLYSYVKGINYYKSFKKLVKDSLSEFDLVDNIYTCMPMRCWLFAASAKSKINIIEHGMSEYNLLESVLNGIDPFKFHKKILSFLLGYKVLGTDDTRLSKFIFMDGNKSNVVKKYKNNSQIPIVSLEASGLVRDIFSFVESRYAEKYDEEYKELMDIKQQLAAYTKRYIYLPTCEVPIDAYQAYLDEQIGQTPMDTSCVLIKPHYYSKDDVSKCFKKHNCRTISIKMPMSKLIPVELLSFILGFPTVWGSFSSALLYSYWWLNSKSILSEVKSSKVNDYLIKEFTSQVGDFRKLATQI